MKTPLYIRATRGDVIYSSFADKCYISETGKKTRVIRGGAMQAFYRALRRHNNS